MAIEREGEMKREKEGDRNEKSREMEREGGIEESKRE